MFKRVEPGQRLRISAQAWNAAQDVAKAFAEGRLGQASGSRSRRDRMLIQNNTGAALPRLSVLGIDVPTILPSADATEYANQPIMSGIAPVAGTHEGKYVVTLEPLAAGDIGEAVYAGAVPVQLNVVSASDTNAEIADGVTATLKSGSTGSAVILWKESGTGTKWALVSLTGTVIEAPTSPTEFTVSQTGHGLTVGKVIYKPGSNWVAYSSTLRGYLPAVVSEVIDANTFKAMSAGVVSGLSSLTAGSVYYANGGSLSLTMPGISVVEQYTVGLMKIGVAISTTELLVEPMQSYGYAAWNGCFYTIFDYTKALTPGAAVKVDGTAAKADSEANSRVAGVVVYTIATGASYNTLLIQTSGWIDPSLAASMTFDTLSNGRWYLSASSAGHLTNSAPSRAIPVLEWDGSNGRYFIHAAASTQGAALGGVSSAVKLLATLTGSGTYTLPSNSRLRFVIIGAGGNGGGVASYSSGGASGGAIIVDVDIAGLSNPTYSAGSAGSPGGNSTLTIGGITFTAPGGAAGSTSGSIPLAGGNAAAISALPDCSAVPAIVDVRSLSGAHGVPGFSGTGGKGGPAPWAGTNGVGGDGGGGSGGPGAILVYQLR